MTETLENFYKRSVLENENGGGWAGIYYGVFSKVVNDNNYKIVAEVGIGYGMHAKYILKTTSVDKLILVDPYKFYPNDGFANDIMRAIPSIPGNNFNELYDLTRKELSPWKERYTWFRTESLSITDAQVPDGSLDCIFVDGDHSYNAVIEDLKFWWKKVRVGGQLLGDDYYMSDVSRAVNDFATINKLKFDFLTNPNSDYKIYRFCK